MRNHNRQREIQRITRDYYQQIYADKMDNLEEMDKFLEKQSFQNCTKKKQKILTHPSQAWKLKL